MAQRTFRALLVGLLGATLLVGTGATAATAGDRPAASSSDAEAAAIARIVRAAMRDQHLRSVIVEVSIDGRVISRRAFGESMTGGPATTDMHFRNGAVAIGYMANVLLQLVDEGRVSLDDKVSRWLPDIANTDRVTLGQLARMTSGYPDYVRQPEFADAFEENPFRRWTPREQLSYVIDKPLLFQPGTNWNYSHTSYVILGLALEKITGMPLSRLLRTRVLAPLGLDQTHATQTARIPSPVLHSFSAERREYLQVPDGRPFLEESTFWNPSWTLARGSVQTTDIDDLHATAIAFGTGALLSRASYRAMISTDLRGFGSPDPACGGSCFTQSVGYSYGIGLVTTGNWVMQNPMFGGYSAVAAYLPSKRVAIAVAATYREAAFADGFPANAADSLFRQIGGLLAPRDAPPTR
ncbi:MAG: serine hydrolase [Actinomycetales bacterium]|nr:serine hydrolase [Actinomycetales bacterium]